MLLRKTLILNCIDISRGGGGEDPRIASCNIPFEWKKEKKWNIAKTEEMK